MQFPTLGEQPVRLPTHSMRAIGSATFLKAVRQSASLPSDASFRASVIAVSRLLWASLSARSTELGVGCLCSRAALIPASFPRGRERDCRVPHQASFPSG